MISKEKFIEIIKLLEDYDKKEKRIVKFLENEIIDDTFISLKDSPLKDAMLSLLKELFNDKYDNIIWWLYDHTERIIYSSETGDILHDLEDPGDFYDFLITTKEKNYE